MCLCLCVLLVFPLPFKSCFDDFNVFFLSLVFTCVCVCAAEFLTRCLPFLAVDHEVMRFMGNDTSEQDFKLILHDTTGSLLVGGRCVCVCVSWGGVCEQGKE